MADEQHDAGGLRASEGLFRALFEQSPLSVQVIAPSGETVAVNRAWEELWGVTLADLPGYNVLEDPQLAANGALPLLRQAFAGEHTAIPPVPFVPDRGRFAGSPRWVRVVASPIRTAGGGVAQVVLVHEDMTDLVVAQEDAARLAAIVEGSEDAIVGRTLAGAITTWNDGAERLYGYTSEEAVGLHVSALVPPDRRPELARIGERLARSERIEPFETVRLRKDGTRVDVSIRLSPIRDADGRVAGVAAIARDVTERKRAEAAQGFLVEASAALAASLDAEATLRRVAELAVPRLADWCVAHAVDGDRLRVLAAAHADPAAAARVRADLERLGPVPAAGLRLLAAGGPLLLAELTDDRLRSFAPDDAHLAVLRGLAPRSAVVAPLVAHGRLLGGISLLATAAAAGGSGRRFDGQDLRLAEELARHAALAVDNARLHRQLAERERRLQELVGRLLAAQEAERRRVAYEVHDGLAQVAAGAYLHLAAYADRRRPRSPEARAELARALELARRTIGEARQTVARLRPTALDDFGLAAALGREVAELRAEGVEVAYDAAALGAERLPPPVETALFGAAREALTNARKHAGPTRVRVVLERRAGRARLEVRDWGRGFDPGAPPPAAGPGEHVGLAGMRERVTLLGGRCAVASRPGAGTRVVVEVPLAPDGEGGPTDGG